jgi:E3 ubiquitin-protein ligase RGLG
MGQKESRPSYNSGYDYGNSSTGYNSRYSANTPSGYSPRYASSAANNVQQPEAHARLQRMYSRIGDDYRSVGQVCVNGLSVAILFSFPTFDALFSTRCS